MDRTSVFPTQSLMDGTRMVDSDCSDMELKLLYDQYLQNTMTEIILKKKTEEKEMLFLSQLATISKEYDHNEEKLFKLKTRERDIINLSKIQNEIDSQINDTNNCTSKYCLEIVLKYHPSRYIFLKIIVCFSYRRREEKVAKDIVSVI